ncbi:Hypothetical predicted protein [Lecanosticta acicola]|uniref:Uncharacterized protein n=1 Tax=Lecanosticta acicola TaxID=111012 RepID=A0AAI9EEK8_9PEZI|nr:Hypothetical predicted protein [Lecanosticta acicola]
MADIQQWRRKIQPASRVRTPALEDTEDTLPPATPKQRGLKSKVSSYFDLGLPKSTVGQEETAEPQLPIWPRDQLYPDPNVEDQMDSVMCRLMAHPHIPLDVCFNGNLMRIFEGYVRLKEERDTLQKRLDHDASAFQAMLSKYNMAEKDWQDEKEDFKEEVKRLEILLSKTSKRGLAEVTLARQDSSLRSRKRERSDHKETLLEFLDRAKILHPPDKIYESQRATMKPLFQSPTDKDKRISQTLAQKKSMTNIHADLPFGTPPRDMRFSLTNASMLEQQAPNTTRRRAATASTDTSVDTFSTFSAEGDIFRQGAGQSRQPDVPATDESAFSEIERLANTIALRRNVDPESVKPLLMKLFHAPHAASGDHKTGGISTGPGIGEDSAKSRGSARVVSGSVPVKRPSALSKASGFFNRLRPQLSVDNTSNSRSVSRRFSFEPGDDGAAQSRATAGVTVPSNSKDRFLRKSVSLDALQQMSQSTAVGVEEIHNLSPVAASPTTSAPAVDGRPPSRIPTPVFNTGYLAKPRQEREDSASSLLTAIKSAEDTEKRSNSLSSSVCNSPPTSRGDVPRISHPYEVDQGTLSAWRSQSSSSNRLLDRTNTLRGGNVAAAAARTTSNSSEATGSQTQPSARSYGSGWSNNGKIRQDVGSENARPMGWSSEHWFDTSGI